MTHSDGRISTILAAKLAAVHAHGSLPARGAAEAARRDIVHSCIAAHGGREFGGGGDSFLAEFPTALRAIQCAVAIADGLRDSADDGRGVEGDVGIGISLGDVREDAEALYGEAVETAKALRSLAGTDGIVVSGAVEEQAQEHGEFAFHRVRPPSHQQLRVKAYRITPSAVTRFGYQFIQELIRRRIFRAAGAYVIVAWLLVQVASIVFPEFDAPPWAMRTLIILLTVGFPILVFLAWTIDITSSGFRLTPDSHYSKTRGAALRFGIVTGATAMSAAFLWWVWTDYIEPTTQRPTRPAITSNPVIAVNTPSKVSGPDEIAWLGDGIANLLRNDLAESRHVIVLSPTRWSAIAAGATSREEIIRRAKGAGIDYVIGGEFLQTPNKIVLTSWIEDVMNGNVVLGTTVDAEDPAGIIAETVELAVRVKQALSIPLHANVNQYAADFAVQNMAAYEAYVAGLSFLYDFDYQQAEESFAAALDLAPDYHMARFRLAGIMESTGRAELALQELRKIPENANLTERERLYIEGARWNFTAERDSARSIAVYRELVDKYPYDIEAGQHLADAYWVDFQEEAAIEVMRGLADLHSYEPSSWMALGEMLLDVGQLAEAQTALTRYAEMAPDDHYGAALLGNLAQLRGDYATSIDFYNQSLALKPDFAVATLGLARSRYLSGDLDAAETLFRKLVDDTNQSARFRIDAAFDLAWILRGQGRFPESLEPLTALEQAIRDEGLRMAMMDATLGLTELERGDLQRAAALIDRAIADSPGVATRYLFARGLLELRTERFEDLERTAEAIRSLALPPENPDRTEDKAASYLLGLAALLQDDLETAGTELTSAVDLEGYEYAIYTLGLSQYLFASGDLDVALEAARNATSARDPGDLRLDMELDRARAMLLHAQILAAMGRVDDAQDQAERFVERWRFASDTAPDVEQANELLSYQ